MSDYEHPNSGTGWIRTGVGRHFTYDPVDPKQISIRDIAHALSHICRFNGHTNRFYSVAQHSLLVVQKMPGSPREKLAALLHDAAEAYVCDIPSPMKPFLGEPYRELHDRVQDAIFTKFGIVFQPGCLDPLRDRIKRYDRAACLFEAEAFFGLTPFNLRRDGWNTILRGLWIPWEPHSEAVKMSAELPKEVAEAFTTKFLTLGGQE